MSADDVQILENTGTDIDGFPAAAVGTIAEPVELPPWALRRDELPTLLR